MIRDWPDLLTSLDRPDRDAESRPAIVTSVDARGRTRLVPLSRRQLLPHLQRTMCARPAASEDTFFAGTIH
jgi:hypothetical protein